jgi:hypothetical protein
VSQEPLETQVSQEINAEVDEYAKMHDLSTSEATQELLRAGLESRRQTASATPTDHNPQRKALEQQQQHLAHQQRQIIRFQKVAVGAGIGWAVLTVATGETGPLWTTLGMLIIVLLAASTYIWQYIPGFASH